MQKAKKKIKLYKIMDKKLTGVQSIGIKLPIIREGDDLVNIVVNSVLTAIRDYDQYEDKYIYDIDDKDIIGITESVVARSQGNYVTIDDIVQFLNEMHISKNLILYSPIMSRNRFSMILKAFARYADFISIVLDGDYDEQGNPNFGINQFTGVDIQKYYKELAEKENCGLAFITNALYPLIDKRWKGINFNETFIDCRCHPEEADQLTLKDIMCAAVTREDGSMSGLNTEYGLLGSNKATEEKLKLFPEPAEAQQLVEEIQQRIFEKTGKHVEVMVYGDGCFKDPVGGIWEWADPVVSPAYTKGLEGTPNEIKIKAFADDKYKDLSDKELTIAIKTEIIYKDKNLVGNMASQGTTPRRYVDLLGSLMDLTSGSGDKGTPIVLVKSYFKNFSD